MKTENKSHFQRPKGGAPGHHRKGNNHGQGKRKDKLFLDVAKSENKKPHRKDDRGGKGKEPFGKRGPGVQKTVAFKPKHGGQRQGGHGKNSTHGNKYNQNGARPQKGKHDGRKGGPAATKQHPSTTEHRFDSKPEKVNYCLAPDRLDAQARAIKQFERQEREQEFERKKQDRQQKHKMMTQKTRKGQPVMQGRLELLYEKVKKVVGVQ